MPLADVESEILAPMQAMFLPPRNMDEETQRATLRGYGDTLQEFDREDLKTAWLDVLKSHMTRSWPVPAVIVLAARKARKDRGDAEAPKKRKGSDEFAARMAMWDRVRGTQMAREAVRYGVAWSLKCLVAHDGKLPEQIDLRELVIAKKSAEETAGRIERGEAHFRDGVTIKPLLDDTRDSALAMYRTLQVREEETQEEIRRFGRMAS